MVRRRCPRCGAELVFVHIAGIRFYLACPRCGWKIEVVVNGYENNDVDLP